MKNDNINYEEVCERIKSLRESVNMSQTEFGEKLILSQDTISLYERCKRYPNPRTIRNIIKTFGVSEMWLKYGKGEKYLDITKNLDITKEDVERLISKIIKLDDVQLHSIEGLIDNCIELYEKTSQL